MEDLKILIKVLVSNFGYPVGMGVEPSDRDVENIVKLVREYDKRKPSQKSSSRFIKPTVDQVAEYCEERGNSVDAQAFIDHYEANGWMRGKTKVKDWKACARTWEKQDGKRNKIGRAGNQSNAIDFDDKSWADGLDCFK